VAGGSDHPGHACFGTAAALDSFLRGLPQGDLVIGNTLPNLNTTAIGGTNYSGNAQITPYLYNSIGFVKAPPGTAFESYDPSRTALAPLQGSLMLDIYQNYFFAPSSFIEVQVIPNDPSIPGNKTSTIVYGGQTYRQSVSGNVQGGFWMFGMNRRTGAVTSDNVYGTFSVSVPDSTAALSSLTKALSNTTPDTLVFLTTIGTPFSASSVPDHGIYEAINRLGGNGFMTQKLVAQSSGIPPPYTVIGTPDRSYQIAGNTIENTSLWSDQKETGQVNLLLLRDRRALNFGDVAQIDANARPCRGSGSHGVDQGVVKIPVQWFFVAALDQELIAIPKY
jgi:hypothetical protein